MRALLPETRRSRTSRGTRERRADRWNSRFAQARVRTIVSARMGVRWLPSSPTPGEPRSSPKPPELTTSDGRKFKLKVPGLAPPPEPGPTEERGSSEPPRDDPRPPVNPDHAGF